MEVIVDVKYNTEDAATRLAQLEKRLAELRTETAGAKKAMKELDETSEDYAERLAELTAQVARNDAETKLLRATEKTLTEEMIRADQSVVGLGDSYNELNASLNRMQAQYKSLTAAERESASGKDLLNKIDQTKNKLKDIDASMGDYFRNVGNYPSALAPLEGILNKVGISAEGLSTRGMGGLQNALKGAIGGVKTFAKTLLTTPLGWISAAIAALIAVFDKLKEAIAKNDDASTGLARLYAVTIQPAIDMLSKVFGKLAEWIGKAANALADFFGGGKDAAGAAEAQVLALDELEDKERDYAENSAMRARDIAEIRAKVAEKEKYTAEERISMLKDAQAKEAEDLKERKDIAQKRLDLLEAEAKRTNDTSDEMKNKISQARAAIYRAEEEYNSGMRKLNKELQSAQNEIIKEQEEAEKKAEEDRKRRAEERAERMRNEAKSLREIQDMAEDLTLKAYKDEGERKIAQMKIQHSREIRALQERLATDKTLTKQSRELLAKYIMDKEIADSEEEAALADELAKKRLDDELKRIDDYSKEISDATKEKNEAKLQALDEQLKAELQLLVENGEMTNEERLRLEKAYAEKFAEIQEGREAVEEDTAKTIAEAEEKVRQSYLATAQSAGAVFSGLSDILSTFGEQNKAAGKASKAFAIASIMMDEAMNIANTAKAISSAVAAATNAGAATGPAAPITTPLFIAELTGAVLGGVAGTVASIKSALSLVQKQKFASGGVVGGTSYTGDRVVAGLNSDEVVLNHHQTAKLLFDIASGNAMVGGGSLAEDLAAALEQMPAPVLQYREFEQFTGDVKAVRMAAEY